MFKMKYYILNFLISRGESDLKKPDFKRSNLDFNMMIFTLVIPNIHYLCVSSVWEQDGKGRECILSVFIWTSAAPVAAGRRVQGQKISWWEGQKGLAFLQDVQLVDGELVVPQPGLYYVYAQTYFRHTHSLEEEGEDGEEAEDRGRPLLQYVYKKVILRFDFRWSSSQVELWAFRLVSRFRWCFLWTIQNELFLLDLDSTRLQYKHFTVKPSRVIRVI